MIINGNISIDVEKNTVTIRLDNGSYCRSQFTSGAKHFLDDEIKYRSLERKEFIEDVKIILDI